MSAHKADVLSERRAILPFDLLSVLREGLAQDRRPGDGLLHCSSNLVGSLRHAQLACANAPRIESELVSDVRLRTGTMWHSYFNELLIKAGKTVMHEVKVNPWLPEGWSGTADWLIWDASRRAYILGDLKTMKGEGTKWINRDGIKEEHLWQLSAYWHALAKGRFPLVKAFTVLYLPMNSVPKEDVEPIIVEAEPLPRDKVWSVMEDRWAQTQEYFRASSKGFAAGDYVNEYLAPPMERVQKLFRNKGKLELKLVPHWSSQYCPYPDELCDCDKQGVTKIGEFTDNGYVPRKGYEQYEPTLTP